MANLYSLAIDRSTGAHVSVGAADTQFVGGTLKTSSGNMTLQPAGTVILASALVFAANIGLTVNAGTSAIDFSGGTGIFKTSSGTNTLSGDTALAANKNLTMTAGTGLADFSNGSGIFKSTTGVVTIGPGDTALTGLVTFSAGILSSGSTSIDFSGNTGTFNTPTGALTIGPGPTSLSGLLTLAPPVSTSGSPKLLTITPPAHTTLATTDEAIDLNFNLARTVQWATGDITTQRAARFVAPTYAFAGASTITTAATLAISGSPAAGTNATITNPYALWVEGGAVYFQGDATVNGNLLVNGTATFTGGVSISKVIDTGLTLWGTPAAGDIGYMTGTDVTAAKAKADSGATAEFYGVYDGVAGQLVTSGTVGVKFPAGLNSGTAPAAGQKVYISAATAGVATNVIPEAGNIEAVIGILKSAAGYDNAAGTVMPVRLRPETTDAINA